MSTSVREKLNDGKLGVGIAVTFLAIAVGILAYMLWPAPRINATSSFYSDDDGQSYFKDSVYKFPPFDHNGKPADEAIVILDRGSKVVGYLVRYTPDALKKLTDKYNADVNNGMSGKEIQHDVLTYMHYPDIYLQGQECKLPGPNNKWIPRSSFSTAMIKTPSGDLPEGAVLP
jgi:hypothetical protein